MSYVQHALSQGRGARHEFTSLGTVTSEDRFDCSFTVHLTIPDDFPLGEAYATVEICGYSFCMDADGSCASASGYFYVER